MQNTAHHLVCSDQTIMRSSATSEAIFLAWASIIRTVLWTPMFAPARSPTKADRPQDNARGEMDTMPHGVTEVGHTIYTFHPNRNGLNCIFLRRRRYIDRRNLSSLCSPLSCRMTSKWQHASSTWSNPTIETASVLFSRIRRTIIAQIMSYIDYSWYDDGKAVTARN